uniref:Uncharacterized protein n=1 Tax=Arion vulgaris TaxID=1028688 RepID=A0A0B6ZWT8_9EUPU
MKTKPAKKLLKVSRMDIVWKSLKVVRRKSTMLCKCAGKVTHTRDLHSTFSTLFFTILKADTISLSPSYKPHYQH